MSSAFERIYAVVRTIPHGRVASYGQVAERAEAATPRVVGFALAALEDDTDVPWHRVLNARGAISLGARDGAATKQRTRLEAEGVRFDAQGRVRLRDHAWLGPG